MKEGYVLKAERRPEAAALERINRYTRRPFGADEVYAFSVLLCDNEVDRDGERFTAGALEKLAELFLGKTGIFNHSMRAQDQAARIYDCRVEREKARRTQCGEPYVRLVARAYLPKCEKNRDFILELESGIKKEVSVGCAVKSVTCSICGADLRHGGCEHEKGKTYGGKLCCAVLDEPADAYEWSFVAVPAQREAGVMKQFSGAESWEDVLAKGKGDVALTEAQAHAALDEVRRLRREAECGRAYRAGLEDSFIKCAGLAQPGIPAETLRRAAQRMDLADLRCFEQSYQKRAGELLPLAPQLAPAEPCERADGNGPFRI